MKTNTVWYHLYARSIEPTSEYNERETDSRYRELLCAKLL